MTPFQVLGFEAKMTAMAEVVQLIQSEYVFRVECKFVGGDCESRKRKGRRQQVTRLYQALCVPFEGHLHNAHDDLRLFQEGKYVGHLVAPSIVDWAWMWQHGLSTGGLANG